MFAWGFTQNILQVPYHKPIFAFVSDLTFNKNIIIQNLYRVNSLSTAVHHKGRQ